MAKLAIFILVVVLVQVSSNVVDVETFVGALLFFLNGIFLSHPRKFLQTSARLNLTQGIFSLV
jgi:hypothetical protein